jgi:hypothetical protein
MTRPCLVLAATLLLACNPDETGPTTTSVTNITSASLTGVGSSSSSSGPGGVTGDPASTDTDAPTTTNPQTTTNDPPDVTGDPPATTGPATGDPLDSSTTHDPPAEGDYAAAYIAGDPNRISVRKVEADLCITLTFLGPSDNNPLEYEITLPPTWKVQGALIHQGAADCLSFEGFPEEPVMALSGNGSATWAGAGCPPTLDIDVVLAFPQDQPWLPAEVLLQSTGVPVQDC